jgi:hypothetical protein
VRAYDCVTVRVGKSNFSVRWNGSWELVLRLASLLGQFQAEQLCEFTHARQLHLATRDIVCAHDSIGFDRDPGSPASRTEAEGQLIGVAIARRRTVTRSKKLGSLLSKTPIKVRYCAIVTR